MAERRLKTCDRGHQFYKSSDCPICPICATQEKPTSGFLSLLSAPARRALTQAGISTLDELSKYSEAEILNLHGIGPKSLPVLRRALVNEGLAFASSNQ
ncbi:MAG TPA: RNA polymerase alpha subunit C-terminal domain-containing protein [Bellilinea sp.]|nr:RNA polymerase alpha subunit C-terminal domain-containing protein [Bellilinea sp.]